MPRIFELRSYLQEVNDSIFSDVADHEVISNMQVNSHDINPKDMWFDVRQPYLGSEQDVINIPGKTTCFISH